MDGQLDFLLSQIALFGLRFWGRHHLGEFQPHLPADAQEHWVGLREAADRLHMSPVTLRKMVARGEVEAKWVGRAGRQTESLIIPGSWIDKQVRSEFPPISLRRAAVRTGLPAATVKWLRQENVLRTRHMTMKPKYLSIEDLCEFEGRIASLGSGLGPASVSSAIAIKAVRTDLLFDATLLGRLIKSLVEDGSQVLGRLGPSLDDLQISECHPFAAHPRTRKDRQEWLAQGRVAKMLNCSTPGVQALMTAGYLHHRKSMARGTVCAVSVREFQSKFLLLCSLSKELGIYSRTLTSIARKHGIPFKSVERYGNAVTILTKENAAAIRKLHASSGTRS